jgi:hypothetical protein
MFCVAKRSILRIRFLSKTHLVGDFPSKLKREVLNTKLSREASLKKESCRCENEAFLPDILQKLKVEVGKTMLSCETSLQN